MKAKKLIAAVMALCIVGGALPETGLFNRTDNFTPITAYAEDYTEYTDSNYSKYYIYSDHAVLVSVDWWGSYTLPAEVEGVPVTDVLPDATSYISAVDENSQYFCYEDRCLLSKDKTILYKMNNNYSDAKDKIPDTVIEARPYSLSNAGNVGLGSNLKIIDGAFKSGYSTSLIIPSTVTKVTGGAFAKMSQLKTITFINPDTEFDESDDELLISGYKSEYNGEEVINEEIPFEGTIIGSEGSTAQAYAEKHGYEFAAFGSKELEDAEVTLSYFETDNARITYRNLFDHVSIERVSLIGGTWDAEQLKMVYTDVSTDVVIPSEIAGLPVTHMRSHTEYSGTDRDITSITVPNTVKYIGFNFYAYRALKEIVLEDGNTEYTTENGILFNKDKTMLMYAPPAVELEEYTVPDTVTEIHGGAFEFSTTLKKINIPASVETIPRLTFIYNEVLEEINVDSENPNFVSDNGVLIDKANSELMICPANSSVTEYTVPDYIKTIPSGAFAYCKNLTSVVVPESVEEVGVEVFGNCTALTSVKLPDNLKEITNSMFWGCTALKEVNIPENVEKIDLYAFADCDSLENIDIPDKVTGISITAFYNKSWNTPSFESAVKTVRLGKGLKNLIDPASMTGWGGDSHALPKRMSKLEKLIIENPEFVFADFYSMSFAETYGLITRKPKYDEDGNAIRDENGEWVYEIADKAPVTVYGYAGSTAETFAKENDFPFIAFDESGNIPPESTVKGDANKDGKVTISDAVRILQYLANSEKYDLDEQAKTNADVDGEAGVTGKDAAVIQQYDAGAITSLPIK